MDEIYEMSAGIVKIDLKAMVRVATCAVRNAKAVMDRYQGEIDNVIFAKYDTDYERHSHMQFYGRLVAEAAQEYSEALQVYHALFEAQTRETLEIVRELTGIDHGDV